ncbi:MAG: BlaI/MecI/CopY family transcriptional regulator [Ruminococcaceae bacterium]|nr:BlaI/MecI/CopY family transcriptional regulator [Oscillospiraceae bacterium]
MRMRKGSNIMARRKRAFNRMPDAELIVMQGIWDAKKNGFDKVRASQLIEAYPDTVGQQKLTTVLTLLTRLLDRGYVSIEKVGRSNIYSAAISEEEYCKLATKDFVSSVCRKSTGNLFAALVDGSMIEDGDIDELRELMNKEDK